MNTMENMAPNGAENNASQEGILDIVGQLQTLEGDLKKLKTNQEELRQMPDRAEKNSLLGEIEANIRSTIDAISELQNKKMEMIQKGDEKYMIGGEAVSAEQGKETMSATQDVEAFSQAVGNEYGGAINKMEKRGF